MFKFLPFLIYLGILSNLLICQADLGNITLAIEGYGYPVETHTVTTPDGYILQLQRIPHGIHGTASTKGPVLLQHGLGSCAADWCLNTPSESLGYLLADLGYDVWLGNNRGNGYSMAHVRYTPAQAAFWNFTWDDMAQYDLPTEIDYVLQTTRYTQLAYMGISQGTTQAFAELSRNPSLADKLSLFVAFAPVGHVYHQRAELLSLLADMDVGKILELLGDSKFETSDAVRKLLPDVCDVAPEVCEYAISFMVGPTIDLNTTRMNFYLEYEMAPTSVKNMIHWAQAVRADVFQSFDYGSAAANEQAYGRPTPPPYTPSSISPKLPIAFFTGGQDYLADATDVALLRTQLPSPLVVDIYEPLYSHIDYVISDQAVSQIYPEVYQLLQKYPPTK